MRLLGAGDNVVDRYPARGVEYPGGNAVNVAVYAAQLGADAAYLGVVGDDPEGDLLRASLAEEGVDISRMCTVPGQTARAEVELHGSDRVFAGSSKGVALFEPDAEQLAAMAAFDVVHSGYAGSLLRHVPRMARQTRVSFDFGSRYALGDIGVALPHLFLATFSGGDRSRDEAAALGRSAVAGGARLALVTLGARGAVLVSADRDRFQPAAPAEVVDTLGAGDAFIAGFLTALLDGADPSQALGAGSAKAAQICRAFGAFGHGRKYPAGAPVAEEVR
ncbi:MAG: PfkB family carbohydrate kinase [Pseudoclavibacter sp.]